ncbi:MAG TPA: hypothetical protein DD457_10030 [Gammaproteobacteria bacterium]|nr:hypothetical protein [Gammaproteobacteria bacterium]HCP50024.1 hypothetical protein [Gammaproteobacteria bacterium]|tara:strand:+ start:840 stop:2075 length:1236 start_codon:yes stop_codon:yes gene_type:complete
MFLKTVLDYRLRRILLLVGLFQLLGCVTQTVRTVDMAPPEILVVPPSEELLLDVGITVFDPNVPESFDEQAELNIQPEIRRAESNYMAYVAKNLLQSTGNWGAVRVVPRLSHAVDLTVSATILHSDGERLNLHVVASDARGQVWFDSVYETLASKYAYDVSIPRDIDPYQATYNQIANDLLGFRMGLTEEEILAIRTTAEMRFARDFATDAFEDYVIETTPGKYQIRRLPAPDDPMLSRVRMIREREYLFIDTLDEYFSSFANEMFTPYQNWRRATYSEAIAYREERNKARARLLAGTAGIVAGVAAQTSDNNVTQYGGTLAIIGGAMMIKSGIAKRANAQLHIEVLRELGVSAEAEIMPHTIELENESIALQGSVDEQYEELRRILRRIYRTEMGAGDPNATEESGIDAG